MNMRQTVLALGLIFIFINADAQEEQQDLQSIKINFSIYTSIDADAAGWGASMKAWYFPYKKFGVGPEVTYDEYNTFLGDRTISTGMNLLYLFNEIDGYRFFISAAGGYSYPYFDTADRRDFAMESKSGGLYAFPNAGIMANVNDRLDITLGFGYLHSNVGLETIDFSGNAGNTDIEYNRYRFSIGVNF